jgi:hypothetical protein
MTKNQLRSSTLLARATLSLLTVGASVVATTAMTTPSAFGSASQTGCPEGMSTFTTAELLQNGFVSAFLDPIDANGDGIVCARPLSPQQQEKFCATHTCTVLTIMAFDDNRRGPNY